MNTPPSMVLTLSLAFATTLGGCENVFRSGTPPAPDTLPAITTTALAALPAAEDAVRLLHLDSRPVDLDAFSATTGCAVQATPVRTSYRLWSSVPQGRFDVVLTPTDVSRRLIRDDVLQPLNPALIPSFASVPTRFTEAPYNRFEGTPFGAPLQWGPQGLLTVDAAFPTPPDTWRVLYEPQTLADGSSSVGRVQTYEGPIALAEAALTLATHDPDLGIGTDPFALTKPQFRAAVRAVRKQREVVDRYWNDPDQQVADVLAGRVVATSSGVYQARALTAAGTAVTFDLPAEGATGWVVTAQIPRDAPHPGCAYRLLEHLLSLEAQAALSDAWASVPVRAEACGEACATYGAAQLDTLHLWRSPERRCAMPEDCVAWHEWISQYTLARGGI